MSIVRGHLRAKTNGDRRYQVDFSGTRKHMGTFHLIDNSKVKVFYQGNMKTCGRCHKPASICIGSGIARNCEIGGGDRVKLIDHMRSLWNEIDFIPTTFNNGNENCNDEKEETQFLQKKVFLLFLSEMNQTVRILIGVMESQ